MLLRLARHLGTRASYHPAISPLPRFHNSLNSLRMSSTQAIAVLNDAELKDGQMKEVDFGDKGGKVLLSRLGDKIHATSAFCTHYGAPLAKGVLTADGRVVCPWHGACFNVCTGDIEDAPAPMALHSFKAHVTDGKIYVTADPSHTTKEGKSRPPRLLASASETSENPVVIVGGGSGAFHAVESLREHGFGGPITVLSKEKHAPIDRTKLSKTLMSDASKLEWRTPADLRIKYGTILRVGVEVTSIDFDSKTILLDDGKEKVSYQTLILAPGGTPRRLPVEGGDLGNIFTLRGVEDSKAIDAACQEGKRLVVIGSSFIGMELVVAVAKRKLASIDVVSMDKVPFERVLGEEVGKGLQQYHEGQGVKFHLSAKIEKLIPSEADSSAVGGVVVDGQTIPADVVIMGVGVAPATEFLKKSGLKLEKDGGVLVDEFLKVKGRENIYAIGDIAVFPQIKSGEPVRIEHWNVAGNHGRAVGKTISGDPQPFVKVPVFWSAQGQQLRYVGLGVGFDDVIVKGNPAEMKFVAYYTKGDKVIAVSSMQSDPIAIKASELLRLGLMPSAEEIKAGKNLLEVDIATVAAKAKVEGVVA